MGIQHILEDDGEIKVTFEIDDDGVTLREFEMTDYDDMPNDYQETWLYRVPKHYITDINARLEMDAGSV